jgi:hypothetical protein
MMINELKIRNRRVVDERLLVRAATALSHLTDEIFCLLAITSGDYDETCLINPCALGEFQRPSFIMCAPKKRSLLFLN